MKPGILSPDFWYKLKVTHFLLKKLSDPGIFSDCSEMHQRPFLRGKNTHQAPETQVCVDIYSGVPEAYLNVTNPEYASGTPQ